MHLPDPEIIEPDLRIAGTEADGKLLRRDDLLHRPGQELAIAECRDRVHPVAIERERRLVFRKWPLRTALARVALGLWYSAQGPCGEMPPRLDWRGFRHVRGRTWPSRSFDRARGRPTATLRNSAPFLNWHRVPVRARRARSARRNSAASVPFPSTSPEREECSPTHRVEPSAAQPLPRPTQYLTRPLFGW